MKVLILFLLSISCLQADPMATDPPSLRNQFLSSARPAIRKMLDTFESASGKQVTFASLPPTDKVIARSIYDPEKREARILLRNGWEDVDVAHELMHFRMDLLEGFSVLAWRRGVEHTDAVSTAFGRLQTYVNDEVVHQHLVDAGLKLDGEVLRSPLFDDLYTNVARYLDENRDRPNDGMAHLDNSGYGVLCRTTFLVQAELILAKHRQHLAAGRIDLIEHFIRSFRAKRPEESVRADAVLRLFQQHDVQTPAGQKEILDAWSKMEGLQEFVGCSAYQKRDDGGYTLPFP